MNLYGKHFVFREMQATNIYHTGASKSFRGGTDWQPPREAVARPGLLGPVGMGRNPVAR